MNMGAMSDYKLGKARYQELEAAVRQEELLGQVHLSYSRGLPLNLSTIFGILVVAMVTGVQVLGL